MIDQKALAVEGFHHITAILKCKWTIAILDAIRRGINRPSRLQKELPGLTPKVLNQRIQKLERFGVIHKVIYPEIPPRVEYTLTVRGVRLIGLLETISEFVEQEWADMSYQG